MKKVKQSVKQNINQVHQSIPRTTNLATKNGAGEGIRALDVLLGKQALKPIVHNLVNTWN